MLNTIGPLWDGNEVWLLTAGGATFAAFPHWYATLFSGFYLPLLLILVALIVRNLGFEYRHKRDTTPWKARWDLAIFGGSLVPALLVGRGADQHRARRADRRGQGVRRQPLHAAQPDGPARRARHPSALFLTHGALFVALKTDGDDPRRRPRRSATTLGRRRRGARRRPARLARPHRRARVASWVTTVDRGGRAPRRRSYANRGRRRAGPSSARPSPSPWPWRRTSCALPERHADHATRRNLAHHRQRLEHRLTLKIMTVAALIFTPIVLHLQG